MPVPLAPGFKLLDQFLAGAGNEGRPVGVVVSSHAGGIADVMERGDGLFLAEEVMKPRHRLG